MRLGRSGSEKNGRTESRVKRSDPGEADWREDEALAKAWRVGKSLRDMVAGCVGKECIIYKYMIYMGG